MRIEYRSEIDGLRAVAVLLIVFSCVPGVLVWRICGGRRFHVVSGYLITRLILQDLVKGTGAWLTFIAVA
jgi:peptidoglycan/LPS O-acetylase OafA/YrhL